MTDWQAVEAFVAAELLGWTIKGYWQGKPRDYERPDGSRVRIDHLLTGDGMLEVKRAAVRRGWWVHSFTDGTGHWSDGVCAHCEVEDVSGPRRMLGSAQADTEPEAVLLAIANALGWEDTQ